MDKTKTATKNLYKLLYSFTLTTSFEYRLLLTVY